jgi:hypothetical protein
VNGEAVEGEIMLEHNDRIIIGTNTVFLIKHPERAESASKPDAEIDYEFAIQERADTNLKAEGFSDEVERIKHEAEERFKKQQEEFE